jgi:hypothetical protein
MGDSRVVFSVSDKGGRRSGIERRRFSYSEHLPERRSGEERRSGFDRRSDKERRAGLDRRGGHERQPRSPVINIIDRIRGEERRGGSDRRSGVDRRDFMVLWIPQIEPS